MILADEEMILITVQIFQNDLNCKDRSENCNTLVWFFYNELVEVKDKYTTNLPMIG